MLNHRKEVTAKLTQMDNSINELQNERMQLKAMVKNQNYHFTEIQKQIGVVNHRTEKLENIADIFPTLQNQINQTDAYLNLYLPMEICAQIHGALSSSLETAPTKMRLDMVDNSAKRVKEILEKIKNVGTENEKPLNKTELKTLRLDFEHFRLTQKFDMEELERIERERKEADAKAKQKTPLQMFEEHLYNGHNFSKLSQRLVDSMGSFLKTKVVQEINEHPSIIKLVTFYNDEFGGSENSGQSRSSHSSKFSLASGTSRSSRS